jgi:hypothetical protein
MSSSILTYEKKRNRVSLKTAVSFFVCEKYTKRILKNILDFSNKIVKIAENT